MNFDKIIVAVLLSFFLFSCGSDDEIYNYENVNVTVGLDVVPYNLELTSDNPAGDFTLQYYTDKLFLISVDSSKLGENFMLSPEFTVQSCLKSIEEFGSCKLGVSYTPQTSGSHSGYIILNFLYVGDIFSHEAKEHQLRVTGYSYSGNLPNNPVDDNASIGDNNTN